MAVTRDEVIRTAMRLLDEVGLDGLTLRRLASALHISAPTLYWHFKDKRDLLDAMAEAMVRAHRETEPPIPEDWPWHERIAESMRQQYRALLAYRDGARVMAGNRPTDASLPMIEHYLSQWVAIGFPPLEALSSILSMGDLIVGAALEYQAEMARQREQAPEAMAEIWEKMKAHPTLYAAARDRAAHAAAGARYDSFEHGLSLMIAGLKQRHAELTEHENRGSPPGSSPLRREEDHA